MATNKTVTVTTPSIVSNDTLVSYNVYSNIDGLLGNMTPSQASDGFVISLSDNAIHNVYARPVGVINGEFVNATSNIVVEDTSLDTEAPVIGVLSLGTVTGTTIELNWTAATDNVGVTSYDIYRNVSDAGYSYHATVAGNVLTYTDLGLDDAVKHDYIIKAKDAANNESAYSNEVMAVTPDITDPVIGTISIVSKTDTTISVQWTAATDNVGVVSYSTYKDSAEENTGIVALTDTITGLTTETEYVIQVRAYDAAGNESALSNSLTVTTNAVVDGNDFPVLSNFTFSDTNSDRIYFDSSIAITAIDATGFSVYEDVTVTGIVVSGTTTGNYLTLSGNLNIFSNPTVEYDDATGNVSSASGSLQRMRMQRIANNMSYPTPITEYYVDGSVGSSGNGLSEGAAFKTAAEGMAVLGAGVKVWIKAGTTYNEGDLLPSSNGTLANPYQIEGYKNTIGDGAELNRSIGMTFTNTELPLFTGGTEGFATDNRKYFIMKNLQVSGASADQYAIDSSSYGVFENCYGDAGGGQAGFGTMNNDSGDSDGHIRVKRCYGNGGTHRVLRMQGRNCAAIDTWAVTDSIVNCDYYINIYGTRSIANGGAGETVGCSVLDCYVSRFETDSHGGHGISMKAGGDASDKQELVGTLIENIDIVNCGQAIELRHPTSHNHVVRNVRGSGTVLGNANCITFRDGTHDNWIEDCKMTGGATGIRYTDNEGEHGETAGGYDNTIVNFISDNPEYHIAVHAGWDSGGALPPTGNKMINCTFIGGDYLMYLAHDYGSTNEFTNCIFTGVTNKVGNSASGTPVFTNNVFYNGFSATGTGQITVNPDLNGSYVPQATFEDIDVSQDEALYDYNGSQRGSITTVGAVSHVDESGEVTPISQSYVFNGDADAYLRTDSLTFRNGILSQSWVVKGKITGTGENQTFVGQETSSVNLRFGATASDTMRWRLGSSNVASGSFDANEHIYICTFDGTNMRINVDGVQLASSVDGDQTTTTDGKATAFGNANGLLLKGEISNIQFYNKALSTGEIALLQADLTDTATGLVANFADQKTSSTWTDEVSGLTAQNQGGVTLV